MFVYWGEVWRTLFFTWSQPLRKSYGKDTSRILLAKKSFISYSWRKFLRFRLRQLLYLSGPCSTHQSLPLLFKDNNLITWITLKFTLMILHPLRSSRDLKHCLHHQAIKLISDLKNRSISDKKRVIKLAQYLKIYSLRICLCFLPLGSSRNLRLPVNTLEKVYRTGLWTPIWGIIPMVAVLS